MRLNVLLIALLTFNGCLFAENELNEESALPIDAIQAGHPERIEVHPGAFTLGGSRQRLQLIVTAHYPNGETADLTRAATYTIAEPTLATGNERGSFQPLANGQTKIEVRVGALSTNMTLTIEQMESPEPVSFLFHTLPVLSKTGCSMGACHGAPHGKGGFRLSLRAFDPKLDYRTLVEEEFGRRVNLLEPKRSLMLAKPRTEIAHEGGQRLRDGDHEQQVLIDWIAGGCVANMEEPKCTGIRITPSHGEFRRRPHHVQQFRVEADFEDGAVRDVTHLAVFECSDETVCKVSRHGLAVGIRRGEAAVIVRYLEHIESSLLSFVDDLPDFVWKALPPANYVDEHVYEKLRQFQYLPSDHCTDEVFIRRVYLDLTGLLPTPEQVRTFFDHDATDKRAQLIDTLLESDNFAFYWAQKWGDLLKLSTKQMGHSAVLKFHRWIHDSVKRNQPYNAFARDILLARGSNLTNPASNFYRTGSDTSDIMESTTQLFMGTRIGCAKCHNHPYEPWTQGNYYGLSAFFNRIKTKKTGRTDEVVVWMDREGEVRNPATQQVMKPWAPKADALEVEEGADRREAFAEWLTTPTNPFFATVEVNRLWAYLVGRGIVEPFDDLRDTNPPANAPLLEALTADFVAQGFDRKQIIRTILNSRTYQASAQANESNRDDTRFFSHYRPRRLTAEQLIDALGALTGVPERFPGVPASMKATQLPAPDLKPHKTDQIGEIEFLKVFGMPERQTVCECERGDETSLGQALELFNGKTIHGMLSNKQNRFHQAVAAKKPTEEILTDLYLRAYARKPGARELEITTKYINQAQDPDKAYEDIVWALINKDEFLFQH